MLLSVDQCLLFNLLLKAAKRAELGSDRARYTLDIDLSVALRTAHEGKVDLESGPSVLEELHDTASVEHVAATKLGAGFRAEFARVADAAELVSIDIALVVLAGAS